MPLSHSAKLATVDIQERGSGLPAITVRGGITASVREYRTRKPSPRPTHALLVPKHKTDHLHNHVNAHPLAFVYAFSIARWRPPFYPRPNIDVSTTSGIAGDAPSPRKEFL